MFWRATPQLFDWTTIASPVGQCWTMLESVCFMLEGVRNSISNVGQCSTRGIFEQTWKWSRITKLPIRKNIHYLTMVELYTSQEILETGLRLAGFEWRGNVDGPTNLRRFSACYGASHSALAALWDGLHFASDTLAALEDDDSIIDLLITLLFFKVYGSEHVTVAMVTPYFVKMNMNIPHETYVRNTVWRFAAKLQAHKEEVIVWPDWEMTQEEDRDQFLFLSTVSIFVCKKPHMTHFIATTKCTLSSSRVQGWTISCA